MVKISRSENYSSHERALRSRYPWSATGSVDVERLADWAYGAQLVERFERAGLHAIEAEAAGFEVTRTSCDGVGQLMQIEHLGCRIDQGSVSVRDAVHPAAYAVAHELAWLQGAGQAAVKAHARAGTRPLAWQPPERRARAAVWVKPWQEAQVEYQGPGRKGGYCQVIITWDAERERWGREQYRLWHLTLGELAWRLSSRALGFVVTGPGAPAEPWVDAKSAEASPIALDARAEAGVPPSGSSQAASDQ